MKFRLATWDEGRKFMNDMANVLNTELEIRDARQVITTDSIEIHFQPDDRGFSFITCKIYDESLKPTLELYKSHYTK
ncbi:MAG: hypothetical protein ACFFB2_10015 [Promethearchaeota archaeon]